MSLKNERKVRKEKETLKNESVENSPIVLGCNLLRTILNRNCNVKVNKPSPVSKLISLSW